jgi:hypothetical protein
MKILSHRGYWKTTAEKNRREAFERSFALGFGTETDVRDARGTLVIAHDMPRGDELTLEDFLSIYRKHAANPLPLALNVKADGLAESLEAQLHAVGITTAFVFDMAVPDMRAYLRGSIPTYTRMSEVEREPAWQERAAGVWLDSFEGNWFDAALIARLFEVGKKVCVVSSELHGRPHQQLWSLLAPLAGAEDLALCTDLPEEAAAFFRTWTRP